MAASIMPCKVFRGHGERYAIVEDAVEVVERAFVFVDRRHVEEACRGICLGSPTTTRLFPRAIAPTASEVGICDASSNTTMSNFFASEVYVL